MSEVRLELLRPILRLLDPAGHVIIGFYWKWRVTRALALIWDRFSTFVPGKEFQIQGTDFLCNNFLTKAQGVSAERQTDVNRGSPTATSARRPF